MRILYFAILLLVVLTGAQAAQVTDIYGDGSVKTTQDITNDMDADVQDGDKPGLVGVFYMLQLMSAKPPVALSSQFSDDLSRIKVQFDRDVLLPDGAATSSTGFGSDGDLGQGFIIIASGNKEITLYLGLGATIALENLAISAGAVFSKRNVPIAATTVPVGAPENPVAPVFEISGPNVVGNCDSFELDANVTGGTGTYGRPIGYAWSSTEPNLNAILVNQTQHKVSIAAEKLPPDSEYQIKLTVTNFVDQSSSDSHNVTVKAAPLPEVIPLGPSAVDINYNDSGILLSAMVKANSCGEVEPTFSYNWSSTTFDLNVYLQDQSNLAVVIPMNYLLEGFSVKTPDVTHYLTLTVSDISTPSVSVSIDYVVTVLGPEASANILGDSEITISTNSNLVIIGEDANYPSGIAGETVPTYEWSCSNSKDNPCVNAATFKELKMSDYQGGETGERLSIPTDVLGVGGYKFLLTLTNWLGESSEDYISVKVVSD